MFISKTDYYFLNEMALNSMTLQRKLEEKEDENKTLNIHLLTLKGFMNDDHNLKLIEIQRKELIKLTEEHRILSIENYALKEALRKRIEAMDLINKVEGV